MLSIILADIRRNIRNKKILAIILAFLCFFSFAYFSNLNKGEKDLYEEKLDLILPFNYIHIKFADLQMEYQHTAEGEERKGLKEEYFLWKQLVELNETYTYEYYAPEYFGWENYTTAYRDFNTALLKNKKTGVYKDELKQFGYNNESIKANIEYYSYFLDHNIQPYKYESVPNLANFTFQLTKGESFFFFLIIFSIILIQQLTHDYESGTYKLIFSQSISRNKIMISKIIATFLFSILAYVIAFALFSAIPLSQHGLGSFDYIYRSGATTLTTYFPTIIMTLGMALLVLTLYIGVVYLLTIIFKQFSNALIALGSIFVVVYFLLRLLGNQLLFAYLPIFYVHPYDIITNQFSLSAWICVILLIICILLLFIFNKRKIQKIDLKGSDAS